MARRKMKDLKSLYNEKTKQLFQPNNLVRFPTVFPNGADYNHFSYKSNGVKYTIKKSEPKKRGKFNGKKLKSIFHLPNEFSMDIFLALQAKATKQSDGSWTAEFGSLNALYEVMGRTPQYRPERIELVAHTLNNLSRTKLRYKGRFRNREEKCLVDSDISFRLIKSWTLDQPNGQGTKFHLEVTFDQIYIGQILSQDYYHSINLEHYYSLSGTSKILFRWTECKLSRQEENHVFIDNLLNQLGLTGSPSLNSPSKKRKAIKKWIKDIRKYKFPELPVVRVNYPDKGETAQFTKPNLKKRNSEIFRTYNRTLFQ